MVRKIELDEPEWPQTLCYTPNDKEGLDRFLNAVGAAGLESVEEGLDCWVTFSSQADVDRLIGFQKEFGSPRRSFEI